MSDEPARMRVGLRPDADESPTFSGKEGVPAPSAGVRRWFLVHAKTSHEKRAQAHLARQDFTTFLPEICRTIRHARRAQTKLVPLFPGYLFVQLDPGRDRWRAIDGTIGVLRLVKAGGAPLPAPLGLVETMLEARDEAGAIDLSRSRHDKSGLTKGEAVRILSGPFAELLGEIDRLPGPERVRVLIKLMGATIPLELSQKQVQPLPSPSLIAQR